MITSDHASVLSLPQTNPGVATVLEYLVIKFPYIDAKIWQQRITDGKVHRHDGSLITAQSPFKAQQRIYYYKEVESEPRIPFQEAILFQDEHILAAYKPHFLPVIPGGKYVNECLQNRLRRSTGIQTLQAVHRLDRVTAGLVIFSVNPDTRQHYHQLFEQRKIHKTYQAIANLDELHITSNSANNAANNTEYLVGQQWEVKSRIERSEQRFRMREVEGEVNSHSVIHCLQQTENKALFELNPITGKTHQLRLHMQSLGFPILNDKYYPTLQPLSDDDYSLPLQLLAKDLKFIDPITQQQRCFRYNGNLSLC